MARYFIETGYMGTRYAGFQVQHNAVTIQGTIDKALSVLLRNPVKTTGSSRTDAGVHAAQNFLHFDHDGQLMPHFCYKLNAILSPDIVVSGVRPVGAEAHARFDALSRSYRYRVYTAKDPFLRDRGYFFPYPVDEGVLEQTAGIIRAHSDFSSFSKRNTQVKTFQCQIQQAAWRREPGQLIFEIRANRFLRGMVRGLVATMLKTARGRMTLDEFTWLLGAKSNTGTDFSAPPQGLILMEVRYPEGLMGDPITV